MADFARVYAKIKMLLPPTAEDAISLLWGTIIMYHFEQHRVVLGMVVSLLGRCFVVQVERFGLFT